MTVSIGLGRVESHKMDPWTTLSDPRSLRRTLHANCAVWQTCRLSSSSTPFRFDARAARSTVASRHRRRPRLHSLRSSRRRPHILIPAHFYHATTLQLRAFAQHKLLSPELHFLTPMCTKSFVGWGSAPDPTGELTALPRPPSSI